MRNNKLSIAVSTFGLLLAGMLAIPTANATTLHAHLYASDYTPTNDQVVTFFADGLAPNTNYSFGYMFAVGDTFLPLANDWVDHSDRLGMITTDSRGSAEFTVDWYFGFNNLFDNYSGMLPTYIFVSELGATPETTTDVITKTHIIYPGQNIDLGTVEISGAGVGQNYFLPGEEISIGLSGFSEKYSTAEIQIYPDLDYNIATDIWAAVFGFHQSFTEIGWPSLDDNGDALVTTFVPDQIDTASHLHFVLYNSDMNDHSATWFVTDIHGNVEPLVNEIIVPAEVPSKVKPYSYLNAVYGTSEWNTLELTNWKYCLSAGTKIIFLGKGKCSWDVLDLDGNVIASKSVSISKSANANNSIPLAHMSVKFAKGSKKLAKVEKNKVTNLQNSDAWDEIMVLGYSWKEGTKKKMRDLSWSRVRLIKSYLEQQDHMVLFIGGHGDSAPLFKKGKSQALNRRVEIVEIPAGVW